MKRGSTLLESPAVDMRLEPVKDQVLAPTVTGAVSVFERLARDPSVDVDKLERLMQMHERVTAKQAEDAFNAEMSDAQKEMRPVAADATNPQTRSKYASYAALDNALRPIYTNHGFALSFNAGETTLTEHVRVVCYVSHRAGHSRPYHVDMPADGKGAKGGDVMTKTHAVGAAMSYGMRYLLKMIFNVAVGEDDRDGNAPQTQPQAPDGYDDWLRVLISKADEGVQALKGMWDTANRDPLLKPYAEHLQKTNPKGWAALKQKAQQVKA